MYFLNGDRIYIEPQDTSGKLDEQIENCFEQLKEINSGKKIFKLNFFIDADTGNGYRSFKKDLEARVTNVFGQDLVLSFIAQPPLSAKIIIEAFYYDPELWEARNIALNGDRATLFLKDNTQILVGTVQSNTEESCKTDSENAFKSLSTIFEKVDFPVNSIVRQWNYLEDIVGFDEDDQRYQEFNNVRSKFYGDAFLEKGYPAATGIGMSYGGVIIEFVAVKSEEVFTKAVDNPGQIAAHVYSDNVLVGKECLIKTTPKFERARYLQKGDKKLIFISGTASITGEKTVGVGDPVLQTEVTIQNIQRLYSSEILEGLSENQLQPKYGHARVYVKHSKDYKPIKNTFRKFYGDMPVVYILADICRNDLLVEIEGKVILE